MAKKKIGLLLICFLLCGCKEAISPEIQFDNALSEVEAMDEMKTTWTLWNPQGQILAMMKTETINIQTDPIVDMTIDGQTKMISAEDNLAKLGRFAMLGNNFLSFSRQEDPYGDIVNFVLSQEDYTQIAATLAEWISSPIMNVSGSMHLDENDSLQSLHYQIETEQGTYEFELVLEEQ